jgi:hypothetical protein
MSYWSIACHATKEVYVREADVVLGPGVNVFTIVTQDLDGLQDWLTAQGVTMRCLHCLDQHEAIDANAQLPTEGS